MVKCGLEIHQQLSTKKLFCDCDSKLSSQVLFKFERILRPTQSELGEVDRAAIEESLKHRKFIYEVTENSCLVEGDEEPPHPLNSEALEITLKIALLLHARIVDEIHVMRKIVIDGSNTSGFQRTALVAVGGYINTTFGKVHIPTICLEEEAARKIEEKDDYVVYRLDRLGIPLIEISTAPDMNNGEQVKEVAQKIGYILRATKKVRRGIGTIRQDINISTGQGRVEIKGASKLTMIPKWVNVEIERQETLKEIARLLKERKAQVDTKIYDITPLFKNTGSKIISKVLKKGGKVLGIRLIGYRGVLRSERYRLGRELADRVRVIGIKGLFHGDELPGYGISEREVREINRFLEIGENDSFVLIAEREDKARFGLERVIERARIAVEGVPDETRGPRDDGTTHYLRPLAGKARMYPETDIPPIKITDFYIDKLRRDLPPLPEERVRQLVKMGINEEIGWQLIHNGKDDLFEEIVKKYGYPTIVARALIVGCDEIDYFTLFQALAEGRFAKEAIDEIVGRVCDGEEISEVLNSFSRNVDIDSIIEVVVEEKREFIKEKGMNSFKPLMGLVMKEVRGKVDGRVVSEKLRKRISKILKE